MRLQLVLTDTHNAEGPLVVNAVVSKIKTTLQAKINENYIKLADYQKDWDVTVP